MSLWTDRSGRIRSGWRVLMWLIAVAAALTALSAAGVGRLPITAAHAIRILVVVAVSLLAWKILDDTPPRRTWLGWTGPAAREAGTGLLAGLLLVAITLAPLSLTGSFDVFARECRIGDQFAFVARIAALFLVAAILEELLFRGYPLYAMASGPGRATAIASTSIVFSLLHGTNPHFDGWAAVVLAGIGGVLAISVLQRRALWEATGMHLGWNLGLAVGAGLPVSGLAMPSPCWSGALSGPEWATGGGFGPEAGAAAAAAWTIAGVWLFRRSTGEDARRESNASRRSA